MEYFNCSPKIDGKSYLTKDFTIECFSGEWNHILPFAIVFTLVYPIGIPIVFAYKLWTRRNDLDNDLVIARYGFLYQPYRQEAFLWDVWEMFRKLFLTGIITLIFPGKSFQVIVVAICNIFFFAFLTIEKPYLPGHGQTLANMSSFAITFTMTLGLILKSVDEADEYHILIATLLIIVNGSVCVFVLYLVIVGTCDTSFTQCLQKLRIKNNNKRTDKLEKYDPVGIFLATKKINFEHDLREFLKMSEDGRKAYENRGENEAAAVAYFLQLEVAMQNFEKINREVRNEGRIIRKMLQNQVKESTDKNPSKSATKVVPSNSYEKQDIKSESIKGDTNSKASKKAKQFWGD
jgi:hypothetical protein